MRVHRCCNLFADRDLKSKNVLIAAGNVLKLTDFGTAKVCDHSNAFSLQKLTAVVLLQPYRPSDPSVAGEETALVGTYEWMAPEVMAGSPCTPASDVYAMTVVSLALPL